MRFSGKKIILRSYPCKVCDKLHVCKFFPYKFLYCFQIWNIFQIGYTWNLSSFVLKELSWRYKLWLKKVFWTLLVTITWNSSNICWQPVCLHFYVKQGPRQGSRKSKIGWELTKNGSHVRSPGLSKKPYMCSFQTNYPYYRGFYASFLVF